MNLPKPDDCTCSFPQVVCRNMSGHDPSCPSHKKWEAALEEARQAKPQIVKGPQGVTAVISPGAVTVDKNFKSVIRFDVVNCARCGGEHPGMMFHELAVPARDYSHWAACPKTGEPIMMTMKCEVEPRDPRQDVKAPR